MSGTFGLDLVVPIELPYSGSGSPAIGVEAAGDLALLGDGDLNATVGDVVDIASPSAWTDLVDLSGGPLSIWAYGSYALYWAQTSVHSSEDAGDSLRIQILIDGTIVADRTAVGNGASTLTAYFHTRAFGNHGTSGTIYSDFINCKDTFKIRAAREGTFASVASYIKIPTIYYMKIAT